MTGPHRLSRRTWLTGAALIGLAAVTACSPGDGPPPSRPSTATDLRARLVAALQPTSPANAELVARGETSLDPVAAEWLPGWQVVDVQNGTGPHPRRFFVALSDADRAEVLTGRPDAFSTVLTAAGVRIGSATVATAVAGTFLDATRDFRTFGYRIGSVDDIGWLPRPGAAEQARRDRIVATHRDTVRPPQAEASGNGWRVTAWLVQGRDLVRHQVDLASGRPVADAAETVERDLPVPYSG